jgi:outer membrane protein assembly factor BamA
LKTVLFIFSFILISTAHLSAENNSDSIKAVSDSVQALPDFYIRQIVIGGNDVTDEDIILRELAIKENTKLNLIELEEDIARIYKLGLFNKVDIIPIPTDTLFIVDLMILVEERFYILPIPQGGFRNGNFSNFWAGVNLTLNNFRGRNETVALSFGIGYEPFVNLSYSVPWIGKKAHFFSSASAGFSKNYNRSIEKLNDSTSGTSASLLQEFTSYNFNASYTLGKYFTNNFSVAAGLKYNLVKLSQFEPGRTLSLTGQDNFLTFTASGRYDTRNSLEYTMSGSLYTLEYIKFGFGRAFDFNKINIDARRFIPIKLSDKYSVTFASRLNTTIAFGGTIPIYLDEFFGFGRIIRGYKNIVLEGENQAGLYNEFRIPVVNPFYVKGESIPIAKGISIFQKLNYKFGLYATLFFDVGGVWNKSDNLFNTRFYNGFGAGLNFILPFGFVGRTDFAFRKENKKFIPQVVFDLDASF